MSDISYTDKIVIIDFGAQTTQLIARRIRELGVYCEIISCYKTKDLRNDYNLKGIILSGGPLSITKTSYLGIPKQILNFNIPILGIKYNVFFEIIFCFLIIILIKKLHPLIKIIRICSKTF